MDRTSAFLNSLVRSAVDAVIATDMDGKILMFNDAAVKICGYSENEALNEINIREIYPEGTAKQVMRMLRSAAYGGVGMLKFYETNIRRKDGELVPISLNGSIIYENNKEVATIGFFRDLRESLHMKEELHDTQIQLLHADKLASLGKLAAGVAHQLNNPLGGITLYTKIVLEEYDLVQEAREDLRRVLRDTQRCRDTVKELLEFARQTRQEMKAVDVNHAISRTLFLLEEQTLFKNIHIEKSLDSSIPDVRGDSRGLNHVFMNIFLNAAEAMQGQGKLVIKSSVTAEDCNICIEISDTGPGIDEDDLSRIFEPFFTTKDEGKGTGLGLSVVLRIIEDHKGTINVKNNKDKGALFTIMLPTDKV